MVRRAQSLMKDRFLFLRHDEQDLDAWVLINGCPRACAGRGLSRSQMPRLSIIEENEFSNLIEWLTALDRSE